MKKLLFCLLIACSHAHAQFVPGQVLTAAELNTQFALYAPLAGATFTGPVTIPTLTTTTIASGANATTQGFTDNSTLIATDNFAKRSILAASATIPITNVTGGTYNFATVGTGAQIVVLASGGSITGVLTIANAGSGYQVGDCLVMVGGNGDAIMRVTSLSGSGVATASVVYGGTGYTTGAQLTGMSLPPGSRSGAISGTLTSNLNIIIPAGTYLQGGRRIGFQNNTTGAFTTTVHLSNGSGGQTGTGSVLPQGTANSSSILLYTDGQNDVWPESSPLGIGALSSSAGAVPLTSLATQAANTIVANATGSTASPTAITAPSCSTTSSALNWTSGTGLSCNTTINASTLGGATFVSPGAIGSTTASTGKFTTLQTTGAYTPSSTSGIVGTITNDNANAGSWGEYLTGTSSAVSMTTAVWAQVASVSLTAGDWDVTSGVQVVPSGGTTPTSFGVGVNTTVAQPSWPNFVFIPAVASAGFGVAAYSPVVRVSLTSTTTISAMASVNFSGGTLTTNGFIRARRVR